MNQTKMEAQRNLEDIGENYDVSNVKAQMPYLKGSEFKENQVLRNITILAIVSHNTASETVIDGVKKTFKEHWIIEVEYDKKQYLLRITSKDVVAMRDELRFGNDMSKWVGKQFDLIVKQYNVGRGFGVIV